MLDGQNKFYPMFQEEAEIWEDLKKCWLKTVVDSQGANT